MLAGAPEELLQKVDAGEATNNIHVWGFCWRLDRILREIAAQGQGNMLRGDKRDVARTLSYLDNLEKYLAYARAEPTPDYVRTHPDAWELPATPELPALENESQLELLVDLTRIGREARRSASNRMKNGFDPADAERLAEFLKKARNFVNSHFPVDGADHPETHTSVPSIPYEGAVGK